ncbi:Ada metal-binding domain-containing protein [Paenibacillus taichungensis]|uniref:Ada metal-binding domain-containing protein n=1 Tax=Paenibacillus taichungensis TaxID=484184 RepID=UPI0035D9AEF6
MNLCGSSISTPPHYILLGADQRYYNSDTPGLFGGYKRGKIYGRLDCPSALRAIERGGYVKHRVFFANEETALAAGYRPCAICMPDKYKEWKSSYLKR